MSFLGPHGSGKTTTLQKLFCTARERGKEAFYFDCETYTKTPPSLRLANKICFIDNAQILRDECKSIAEFAADGMSFCLAFSPVLTDKKGNAMERCPLKAILECNFTPFTENEFDSFVSKTSFEGSELIKEVGIFLPRLIKYVAQSKCQEKLVVEDKASSLIIHCCRKITYLGSADALQYQQAFLSYFTTPQVDLTSNQRARLLESGLFFREQVKVFCAYPHRFVLRECYLLICHQFKLLWEYDKGASLEFLFAITLMQKDKKVVAKCKGSIPTCLSKKATTAHSESFDLRATKYLLQTHPACLPHGWDSTGVILIKLVQKHPAVDFLVINNWGASSKRLFFVQVSAKKYQERSKEKRCSAVEKTFKKDTNFALQSPLLTYSKFTSIPFNRCYYVYASPEVDLDKKDPDINTVYFCKLSLPPITDS